MKIAKDKSRKFLNFFFQRLNQFPLHCASSVGAIGFVQNDLIQNATDSM